MKKTLLKFSDILGTIFGYGIALCLFLGGATMFGYIAALIIGGEGAIDICNFIYNTFIPYVIKASTILVLVGLASMYLKGEVALTTSKKK